MKKKMKKAVYKFIKCEGITATIAAMVILIVFIKAALIERQDVAIIDWAMFTSIVVALLLNSFSKMFRTLLMNKLEDSVKLTCDYEKLMKKYECEMVAYKNEAASCKYVKKVLKNRDTEVVHIPVVREKTFRNGKIEIQDSRAKYVLPQMICEHFGELFEAHSTSTVYNQLAIRVDDWEMENGKFVIKTSRTTYFDSLVTNRAMDFCWSNGLTIREQFEYGPYLHGLKESCLSNHLGFNGFIESSDGYIVLMKRGNKLSIGKGTYGSSVGASLKAKYALIDGKFTREGLRKGILKEIENELKISEEGLEAFSLDEHLIAAYRDLVEGGKPQLLFYIKSKWPKDKIETNFFEKIKGVEKSKKYELLEDGRRFLWISQKDIKEKKICILPDQIVYDGRPYHMMPSVAASIVMLTEYLK